MDLGVSQDRDALKQPYCGNLKRNTHAHISMFFPTDQARKRSGSRGAALRSTSSPLMKPDSWWTQASGGFSKWVCLAAPSGACSVFFCSPGKSNKGTSRCPQTKTHSFYSGQVAPLLWFGQRDHVFRVSLNGPLANLRGEPTSNQNSGILQLLL